MHYRTSVLHFVNIGLPSGSIPGVAVSAPTISPALAAHSRAGFPTSYRVSVSRHRFPGALLSFCSRAASKIQRTWQTRQMVPLVPLS